MGPPRGGAAERMGLRGMCRGHRVGRPDVLCRAKWLGGFNTALIGLCFHDCLGFRLSLNRITTFLYSVPVGISWRKGMYGLPFLCIPSNQRFSAFTIVDGG